MEGEREICDAVALNEELQAGVRGRRVREREREREGREEEGEEGGEQVRHQVTPRRIQSETRLDG